MPIITPKATGRDIIQGHHPTIGLVGADIEKDALAAIVVGDEDERSLQDFDG